MQKICSTVLLLSFVVASLPVFAQQVIATVPVGSFDTQVAVNPVTNRTYVVNTCGSDPNCQTDGTVSVIDGASNTVIATVTVGSTPVSVAVNSVTNKIYVGNECANDSCDGPGTVSVIDGASNTVIATVTVGSFPNGVAVNPATNKIYVVNYCNNLTCQTYSGTMTVIDGASNTVIAAVTVGSRPYSLAVNSVTNKIYVVNACGNDPTCGQPYSGGTVTVIDGATNNPTSVNVGVSPYALDVNSATIRSTSPTNAATIPTVEAPL